MYNLIHGETLAKEMINQDFAKLYDVLELKSTFHRYESLVQYLNYSFQTIS